jgi:thiol-disulfide isomerase/thioredoxin
MIAPLLATVLLAQSNTQGELAQISLSKLEAKARFEHKNVLVVFHASWCGWCHKLDGLIEGQRFGKFFSNNYEILQVDVSEQPKDKALETPGGEDLSRQFGASGDGLPFFVAVSPKGQVIMNSKNGQGTIGYPSEPGEITFFSSFLRATAPHATPPQIQAIQTYLSSSKTQPTGSSR